MTSEGWRTTLTEAPITISKWAFEVVTVTKADSHKCEGAVAHAVTYHLATTTGWPAATFVNAEGVVETTIPEEEFPAPPTMSGSASQNSTDSWPPGTMNFKIGLEPSPAEQGCHYLDPLCTWNPWQEIIPYLKPDAPEPDDEEEQLDEDDFDSCPYEPQTSTFSVEEPTQTAIPVPDPEPSPYEHGDPMQNEMGCYNSGRSDDHVIADNAIKSYCNLLLSNIGDIGVAPENYFFERPFEFPVQNLRSPAEFIISLSVGEGCEWLSDKDECTRYLLAPIDACNCGGKNGKQGGTVSNNCLSWRIDPNSK